MIDRKIIENQLPYALGETDYSSFGELYEGKVRDCFVKDDKRILITSDRLSAFDVVLSTVPFKGQVLNDMAYHWFKETEDIVENHIIDRPHPNVFVCKEVKILPVEVIIRGYLTGSAWRDYQEGKDISGISLPKGLKKSHRFDKPLITPSTKAEKGEHDEPISSEEIVSQGLVEKKLWEEVCATALSLYERGVKKAAERGLILVDTKYEFGTLNGKLILADEVHTSDSSRYWLSDSYQNAYDSGQEPQKLDKEFVRSWLIEQGYMGEGTPPEFSDSFRVDTAEKYVEAYEKITGANFSPASGDITSAIKDVLASVL